MTNQSNIRDESNSNPFQGTGIINNHSELLLRISDLKAEKKIHETELKNTFSVLVSTLNLISIFKSTPIKDEHPLELVKLGVNKVIDLVIDIALGRHRSLKGFLSSVLVEQFTTALINNNLITIITGISSLLRRRHNADTNTENSQ